MKRAILLVGSLFLSACTFLPISEEKESGDQDLETFYLKLNQENNNIELVSKEEKSLALADIKVETKELATKEEIPTSQEVANTIKLEAKREPKELQEKEKVEKGLSLPETKPFEKEKKEEIARKQEIKKEVLGKEGTKKIADERILFIGDSVMKGSEASLQKMYPNAIIDSSVSRQFTVLPDILRKVQNQREGIPETVVIHLGSNGTVHQKQMEEAMKLLGNKRKIFFINCKVERPWQNSVNAFLKTEVEKYPNATLIDWYQISAGQNSYFGKDGVHPSKAGAQRYRKMIEEKLEKDF